MKLLRYTDTRGNERIGDITQFFGNATLQATKRPDRPRVTIWFEDARGNDLWTIDARTTMQQVTNAILELSAGNTIAVLWPKDEVVEE